MTPPVTRPPRYVALVWPPSAAKCAADLKDSLRRVRPDWSAAADVDGLFVLSSGDVPPGFVAHRLDGDSGVILGALFSRRGARANGAGQSNERSIIGAASARAIVETSGRILLSSFWGRYVAFIRDPLRGKTIVIRDPSAALPCFAARNEGVHIYFSDVEAAADLLPSPLCEDEAGLIRRMIAPEIVDGETGLAGIGELLAGERRIHAGQETRRDLVFDIGALIADPIDEAPSAAGALLEATQTAVDCWASLHPSIVHSLSGGLDSSIVLACLSRSASRPRIASFHYFAEDAQGDERRYARLAAAGAGSPLVEAPLDGDGLCGRAMIEEWLDVPLAPCPTGRIFGKRMDRLRASLARETGASAFFSGEGGDHVFFKQATTLGAADYCRRHGIDRVFAARVREAASLAEATVWSALRSALHFGVLGASEREPRAPAAGPFLRKDAIETARRRVAPSLWSAAERHAPPGKARHIASIRMALHRPPAFGLAAAGDVINPLLSQPVVEACLGTPVYVLGLGGRDRGLARRAFGDSLPAEIAARNAKGGTTRRFIDLYRTNFQALRDFLLGGALSEARFIDRDALELFLTPDAADREDALLPLFLALTGEAWLRRLRRARRSPPA